MRHFFLASLATSSLLFLGTSAFSQHGGHPSGGGASHPSGHVVGGAPHAISGGAPHNFAPNVIHSQPNIHPNINTFSKPIQTNQNNIHINQNNLHLNQNNLHLNANNPQAVHINKPFAQNNLSISKNHSPSTINRTSFYSANHRPYFYNNHFYYGNRSFTHFYRPYGYRWWPYTYAPFSLWGTPYWGYGGYNSNYYYTNVTPDNVNYLTGYDNDQTQDPNALTADTTPDFTDSRAHIHVILPTPDAVVLFDGNRTSSTGAERDYDTPVLPPNQTFTYTISATWQENGQTMQQDAQVRVQANGAVLLDFTRPNSDPSQNPTPTQP